MTEDEARPGRVKEGWSPGNRSRRETDRIYVGGVSLERPGRKTHLLEGTVVVK